MDEDARIVRRQRCADQIGAGYRSRLIQQIGDADRLAEGAARNRGGVVERTVVVSKLLARDRR